MKTFHYMVIAIISMLTAGCSSIDCNIEGRVMCHYAFQDYEGNAVQMNAPLSVAFHRAAADSDTIFLNQMSGVSSLDLPMSYDAEYDEIEIQLHVDSVNTIKDIIRIKKENHPVFESVDCAPRYKHTITDISSTHNLIDTVIINNPKVSNDAKVTNIYIRLFGNAN